MAKVYVGNLSWGVDDAKLRDIFSEFGEVSDAVVIKDRFTKRSKGFGFVEFSEEDSAQKAISAMNGKEVEGRAIKVSEAKPMEDRPKREFRRRF